MLTKRQIPIVLQNYFIEDHSFDIEFEIAPIENKKVKVNILKSLEINSIKHCSILLNDQPDINNSILFNPFE